MATFTNMATLSYNGGTVNSNIVSGEITEVLSAEKTAVTGQYSTGDTVTYAVSIVNTGTAAFSGLTVTDDLGGYDFDGTTVYPLEYTEASARLFVNGQLTAAPAVQAGPPLVFSGINIPARSNAILIYEARVTDFADPASGGQITNTAVISGAGLTAPLTVTETVTAQNEAVLGITKALSPVVVPENGIITYTFTITNAGNTPALATDNVIITDLFEPILSNITVTYNSTEWSEPANYTYDETTGLFRTQAGQITVPAAVYTRSEDGTFAVTPGVTTLTVTGTI